MMSPGLKTVIYLSILVLLSMGSAEARIIYVDIQAQGKNDGSSWEDAFDYLKDALAVAEYGDTIWMMRGDYANLTGWPYELKSGVKIFGGFSGSESSVEERDFEVNKTQIKGLNKAFLSIGTDSTTLLDGLEIYGGRAIVDSSDPHACDLLSGHWGCWGGGVFIATFNEGEPACLKIRNCVFRDNRSQSLGGAVFFYSSSGHGGLWIDNCVFIDNICMNNVGGGNGGALAISTGLKKQYGFEVKNTRFVNNEAVFNGAMLFNHGDPHSNLKVSHCTFEGNRSRRHSGAVGITNIKGIVSYFTDCRFIGNLGGDVPFFPGQGGAVRGRDLAFARCLFHQNRGYIGGAVNGTDMTFLNCAFTENYAGRDAGAVKHLTYGDEDNLLSHMYVHCTFADNYAAGDGGAIWGGFVSRDTFINCIFTGNDAGERGRHVCYSSGSLTTVEFDHNFFDTRDTSGAIVQIYEGVDSTWLHIGPHNIFSDTNAGIGKDREGRWRPGNCSPLAGTGDLSALSRYAIWEDLAGRDRSPDVPPTPGAYEIQEGTPTWHHRDESCHAHEDGAIWSVAEGWLEPFSYRTGDLEMTDTLYVGEGEHWVYLIDAAGCTDSTAMIIEGRNAIHVEDSIVHAGSVSSADGQIHILNVEGEYPPFVITWSTGETGEGIEGLSAGGYSVTITDSIGCEAYVDYEVSFSTLSGREVVPERIRVWPNPARQSIFVDIPPIIGSIDVLVYDQSGQLVTYQKKENEPEFKLDLPGTGIFSVVFLRSGNLIATRRVVKIE